MDNERRTSNGRHVPASDQYSLVLGRAVAAHLVTDGERVRAIARRNLTRAGAQHDRKPSWLGRWQELLDGPEHALLEVLTSPDEHARVLRQSSPFAGVLTPQERWLLLQELKEAQRAARSA